MIGCVGFLGENSDNMAIMMNDLADIGGVLKILLFLYKSINFWEELPTIPQTVGGLAKKYVECKKI